MTNAPNISTVNQVKTKAEQLDQAMEGLIKRNQRQRSSEKQGVNFTDADPEKKIQHTTMR